MRIDHIPHRNLQLPFDKITHHHCFFWKRQRINPILKSIFPNYARGWGLDTQTRDTDLYKFSWRRPFIVAEQHPLWGAEMASAAGATPLTASLILKHQTTISADPAALEDRLLLELQAADSAS